MQKLQISLDATKIDKKLMRDRKYVELDVVPLKEPKPKTRPDGTEIKGDTWKLIRTHFVVQSNKEKGVKMPIIGEGTIFEKVEAVKSPETIEYPSNEINPEDVPF